MSTPQSSVLRYLRGLPSGADGGAPDGALACRLAAGDEAACAELLRRHGPLVWGVCRRALGDSPEAEDAFQATFLVLLRRGGALRWPDRLGPWLFGVARRVAGRARARRARRLAREQDLTAQALPGVVGSTGDDREWLDLALAGLPARYREVLILCGLQGVTQAEAARRLGCPLGTVATRAARGRELLRERLARLGALPAGGLAIDSVGVPPTLAVTLRHTLAAAQRGGVPVAIDALTKGVVPVMTTKLALAGLTLVAALGLAAAARPPAQPTARPTSGPTTPVLAHAAPAEAPAEADGLAIVETDNFRVTAPSRRVARLVADAAERARKSQARSWLGKELPRWARPCPVKIRITADSPGSSTTFAFDAGRVESREMQLSGPLDRILLGTLPHEVTHTVLADHFGRALPRWADEGASVLAEDDDERARHARLAAEVLRAPGRAIPLARLLSARDYPLDVMALYAQGYSLTDFLVRRRDRATFLAFVKDGLDGEWDAAAKKHYGLADVAALEEAWVASLRRSPLPAPPTDLEAANPCLVTATLSGDKLSLKFSAREVRYQRATWTGSDGKPQSAYVPIVTPASRIMPLNNFRLSRADGRPVTAREVADRLREPTTILLAGDDKPVAAHFLRALKDDTIVAVELAPATPAPAPPLATPPAAVPLRRAGD